MNLQVGQRVRLRANTDKGVVTADKHDMGYVGVRWDKGKGVLYLHREMLIVLKPPKSKQREVYIIGSMVDRVLENGVQNCAVSRKQELLSDVLFREVSKTPRKGKFVTRDMLAKAWDEIIIMYDGVKNSHCSTGFQDFCKALGLESP